MVFVNIQEGVVVMVVVVIVVSSSSGFSDGCFNSNNIDVISGYQKVLLVFLEKVAFILLYSTSVASSVFS